MSDQELKVCEEMLKGLLLPDNEKRKVAEGQLQQCLSSNQNKVKLALYCSFLLLKSNDLGVHTYCAIIIRKVFLPNGKEEINELVKLISPEDKNQLKLNLLNGLQTITNNSLRKKVADASITFFESVIESREKWDEFLKYIISLFNLELNEQNFTNIELGLHLLSNVYSIAYDELKEGVQIFLKNFTIYFKCNSLSLKAKTVQCINELLCSSLSKKETKQFTGQIFSILETTLKCLQEHDMDNLKVCLDSLQDLSNCEPKILRKSFNDIFILMGKIVEDKEADDNLREIAFEIIVSLVEGIPKLLQKDEEKLKIFVQCLFKYAMELDQTIDNEWLNPNPITFISDEFIPESKLDEACSLLTRLFDVVDEEKLLKITSDNVIELIKHSSDDQWKYKYIAYITIAEIAERINDIESINQLIKMIINDLFNKNIKVQYASLYCIAELSSEHSPDFQNTYHEQIVPKLIKLLSESKCLRVQLEICDALDMFVEHLTDDNAAKYMQSSLDVLFNIFIKPESECPPALKEGILDVVKEFINASEEEFKKYSEKCLQILFDYLSNILNKNINRNLIGPLLEVISEIGPLCPEVFNNYLITLVNTLIQINSNMPSFKENIANYLMSTWEKLIPLLKENNKDKIPIIVNSLVDLLKKPPEMSISSNPNQKIDVQSFFSEEKKKKVKDKVELKTSETEEFETFIEILNLFLSECPELYPSNIIDSLYPIILKLISYPNSDIKIEISKVFANSIEILVKINVNKNYLHATSKQYISNIVEQLMKETDYSVIVAFVDSLKDIIKATKLFLNTNEINELSKKILEVFDKIEKGRESLIKQKDQTEKEFEEEKKTGDNKIYSDDEDDDKSEEEVLEDIKDQISELESVLTSLSDFFGALFETHKNLTLELVDKIIKEYLPIYFRDDSSNFEKTLGLLLLDDMAEFLQQDLLNNIWEQIQQIMIKYSDHNHYEVRNAACYGLGVFSQFTTQNYLNFGPNILTAIMKVIKLPIDKKILNQSDKENFKFARDNAVSALGKIIKYHGQEFPTELDNLIDFWVNSLPITKDKEEAKINNKFLLDVLMKEPNKVLGPSNKNLGQIIVILAKGYNTDSTDKEMDKNIESFAEGIKKNEGYKSILKNTVDKQKGKTLNKIKSLFKLDK